jgi:hypothetical protein
MVRSDSAAGVADGEVPDQSGDLALIHAAASPVQEKRSGILETSAYATSDQ